MNLEDLNNIIGHVFLFVVLILSILFTIKPPNLKNIFLKKHDQISINLTNVFDHGPTLLSMFV